MLCRICNREIPDNSIYCNWCGGKQLKVRKKRDTVTIPEPKQLKSGTWFLRFRINGERYSVTADSKDACKAKGIAIKSNLIKAEKTPQKITLEKACRQYISERENILSPSTVRGYNAILATRFTKWLSKDIYSEPNWQSMINEEARRCSPKTLKNAWGFIAAVLRDNDIDTGNVVLPQVIKKELPWLDYQQIKTFTDAIYGKPPELAALLALHGLRSSEIFGLDASKINILGKTITVQGSVVRGNDNAMVYKETNKNTSSQRIVPILSDRLLDLLRTAVVEHPSGPLIQRSPNTVHSQIDSICESVGLPCTGFHGLRRSFASLAYHLGWSELETMRIGGWSDYRTMKDIYTKLASQDLSKSVKKMSKFYRKNDKTSNKTSNKK